MRVLIACESSGRVRDAFAKRGHDAWSCDLLPTEVDGQHIQDDVLKHLDGLTCYQCKGDGYLRFPQYDSYYDKTVDCNVCNGKGFLKWDLMIAHPPCTYLSYVGTRHWNNNGRYKLRWEAIKFFMNLVEAPIEKICIENPLGIMGQVYRPSDQTIHPYYFGEEARKRTCLWLKRLPKLVYILNKVSIPSRTVDGENK